MDISHLERSLLPLTSPRRTLDPLYLLYCVLTIKYTQNNIVANRLVSHIPGLQLRFR